MNALSLAEQILEALRSRAEAVLAIDRLRTWFPYASSEGVLDALADLEHRGMVQAWVDCPNGPAVILSPLAKGPGWMLREHHRSYRWEKQRRRPEVVPHQFIGFAPKRSTAHDCPPTKRMPYAPDYRPIIFLGERLAWSGPAWTYSKVCPACAGWVESFSTDFYCLVCDGRGRVQQRPPRAASPSRERKAG